MQHPTLLKQLRNRWKAANHGIALIMNAILLTILWIVMIGTYSVIRTMLMLFSKKQQPGSFWRNVSREPSDFRHQF